MPNEFDLAADQDRKEDAARIAYLEMENDRLRSVLISCAIPIEVIGCHAEMIPYKELSPEIQSAVIEARNTIRAALPYLGVDARFITQEKAR